jgi:hypothetical protein
MVGSFLVHLVRSCYLYGSYALLAPCSRACRQAWPRRCKHLQALNKCSCHVADLTKAVLLPGWVASAMFTAATLLYNYWGQGGRHIWDIEPEKRQNLVLSLWLCEVSFLVCGGLTKVSVLLFYRRLVDGLCSGLWKWLVLLAIAFTTAYTIAFVVLLFFNCTPMVAYWRAFDPGYASTVHYTCLNTDIANVIVGICAGLSDLYAVALPCIITWHYSVPRAKRVALNIVFSFGLIVVAASGARTYYLFSKSHQKDDPRERGLYANTLLK